MTAMRRREQGFTLVELIMTMVVIGLIAAFGSSMFSDVFRTTRMVDSSQTSADQARYALERIARELRQMKYTTGTGYIVTSSLTTDATSIAFTDAAGTAVSISKTGST